MSDENLIVSFKELPDGEYGLRWQMDWAWLMKRNPDLLKSDPMAYDPLLAAANSLDQDMIKHLVEKYKFCMLTQVSNIVDSPTAMDTVLNSIESTDAPEYFDMVRGWVETFPEPDLKEKKLPRHVAAQLLSQVKEWVKLAPTKSFHYRDQYFIEQVDGG